MCEANGVTRTWWRVPGRRTRFAVTGALLAWVGGLAIMLAACGAASTRSAAVLNPQSVRIQATQAAESVSITMFAQEQGSIASHHLLITITFTVTNQLTVPIHMYHACGPTEPPLYAFFLASDGRPNYGFRVSTEGECSLRGPAVTSQPVATPNGPAADYPPVLVPGASHTWTYLEDDSANTSSATVGNGQLIVPDMYVIAGWVTWHTGTLGSTTGYSEGFASAETAVKLT